MSIHQSYNIPVDDNTNAKVVPPRRELALIIRVTGFNPTTKL
jgi:hypothetical protein